MREQLKMLVFSFLAVLMALYFIFSLGLPQFPEKTIAGNAAGGAAVCPDNYCDANETYYSCKADCPDITPPMLRVLMPRAGDILSDGHTAVIAEAYDNINITNLTFSLNGVVIAIVPASSSFMNQYTAYIDSSSLGGLSNTLEVVATDITGLTTRSQISVRYQSSFNNVLGDSTPPTITITQPTQASTVSGIITAAATVTDNAALNTVYLYLDGMKQAHTTSGSTYSMPLNTYLLPNGVHSFGVYAADTSNNSALKNVTFTVSNAADTTQPTISITSPAANAQVWGATTISTSATDNVGVNSIEIRIDNVFYAELTPSNPSVVWDSTAYPLGTHTITATAFDYAGNSRASSTTFTIQQPTIDTYPPTVIIVKPVENQSIANPVAAQILTFEQATCKLDTTDGAFASMRYATTTADKKNHYSTLTLPVGTQTLFVRCQDLSGNTNQISATARFSVSNIADTTKPSQVSGLSATASSLSQINLVWNPATDNVGVAGYKIYRAGALLTTLSGTATSYIDSGLSSGTTYTYTVQAYDAAGNAGSQSVAASATTQSTGIAPSPPTILAAAQVGTQIRLAWVASASATSYQIERASTQAGTYVLVGSSSWTNYTETPPAQNTVYYYRVRAVNSYGTSASTAAVSAKVDTQAPTATISAPSANQKLQAGTVQTTLSVTTNEAATCRWSTTNVAYNNMQNTFTTTGTTSHSTIVGGLTNGQTYTRYVRCQDKITPPNQMSTSASVTFSVNAAGLPSGLVAKYSFVNGLATDTSGNNLGGVVQGATKVAGKYGDGLSLDGVNDYINFASPAQLDNLAPGSYTVWIKPSTNAGYVLSRRDAGCTGYWRLGFGTTGPHWLNQRGASATSTSVTPLNTWSHVAVTWDGTKTTTGTKIYVNGIDKTGTVTPLGSTASDAGCSFSAGARSASTEWFNGSLDEIRVYNRVLSPAEVQSDMNTP